MKKNKNNKKINQFDKEAQFSDEEMENVNGGMKVVVVDDEEEEEKGWFRTFIDFFFKVRN